MSTIEQEVEAEYVAPAAAPAPANLKNLDVQNVVRRGRPWAARKIDPR
jgi:hypothetical protein